VKFTIENAFVILRDNAFEFQELQWGNAIGRDGVECVCDNGEKGAEMSGNVV
jgi:hypothetical protein